MPISHSGLLFQLVKSLTKAEKRNFKLFVKRIQGGEGIKFVELFDILDKQNTYDERDIYAHFTGINKVRFSNLKRHLYTQILASLRQIYLQKHVDIQIREHLDYARILYSKGLYMHSLKLLDRIKALADKNHEDILHLQIMEFEKLIESRHITRSRLQKGRIPGLISESLHRSKVVYNRAQLTNLKLELHGFYILQGHATKQEVRIELSHLLKDKLPPVDYRLFTFFEKVDYHQIMVWYQYAQQDFLNCYRHSRHWVDLFEKHPNMQMRDPNLYMRGFHYLLTSVYNLNRASVFEHYLSRFEDFNEHNRDRFNTNSRIISFLYRYIGRLNLAMMTGNFEEGLKHLPRINRRIKRYSAHIDVHRILVFYYKVAALYIGIGKASMGLDYLNKIHENERGHLRKDIHLFSRLMSLLAHYDLGNITYLEYLVDQTQRFMNKIDDTQQTPFAILKFFKKLIATPSSEKKELFREALLKFEIIKKDPNEMRSFVYLDFTLWLKSKLKDLSIEEVLRLELSPARTANSTSQKK